MKAHTISSGGTMGCTCSTCNCIDGTWYTMVLLLGTGTAVAKSHLNTCFLPLE